VKLIFGCWLLLWATWALAGVIELHNGDRLQGELVRIDGEHIVWKSTNFGEQRVKKKSVKNILSEQVLKVNGSKSPCHLEGMDAEYLLYRCTATNKPRRVSLLTLKTLMPYEDYKKGAAVIHGRFNLWGAYARGNEVRDEWNFQSETDIRRGEFRHAFGGEYAESSWEYSAPQARWNAHYTFDWFLRARWFWYVNSLIGVDKQRGFDNYSVLGTGAGYQFFENSRSALSMKLGLSAINEHYIIPPEVSDDYADHDKFMGVRFVTDFRYGLPWEVSFFHNNELIYSVENSANWGFKSTTGLSSMIFKRVYSEFKVDYWIDNQPQPTRESRDTRMSLGVSYKW